MVRILITIAILFFFTSQVNAQQELFKRETELIKYIDDFGISQDKSVILFIQNLFCAKGCDPFVFIKVNKVVSKFPNVKFEIIHTLKEDTMFAANSYLAKKPNVKIFCDESSKFRRAGLDFLQHKFFIVREKKVFWWNHFDSTTIKEIIKILKKYHKEGVV